jgi:endonuclease III
MELFENNWSEKIQPLLKKYKGKKHPLDYQNVYQLMIAVILSARDSDANINKIGPLFFAQFPNLETLSKFKVNDVLPFMSKVTNFNNKAEWIIKIAQTLKKDSAIPTKMDELIALKGIGRKSANVIMREMKAPAEGIIADLHVIRVAPRIGLITEAKDGNKVEKQLMQVLPKEIWGEIGMAISFLGREICRPTNPKCIDCPISSHCQFTLKTI